jgi:hypothetical protein
MSCPTIWAAEQNIVMAIISTVSTGDHPHPAGAGEAAPGHPDEHHMDRPAQGFSRENPDPMPGASVAPGSERSGYRHMPPICAPILPMPAPGWWP